MRILTEEELYEMSNVRPFRTGFPMVVWIHESSGNERHYARIKVSVNYGDKVNMQEGFFTVTVPNKEIIGDTRNIKNRDIYGPLYGAFIPYLNTDICAYCGNVT